MSLWKGVKDTKSDKIEVKSVRGIHLYNVGMLTAYV